MYWGDAHYGTIETAYLNRTGRKTLLNGTSARYFAFTLRDDDVYFTDWSSAYVFVFNTSCRWAQYCDERVCLSVFSLAYPRNHTPESSEQKRFEFGFVLATLYYIVYLCFVFLNLFYCVCAYPCILRSCISVHRPYCLFGRISHKSLINTLSCPWIQSNCHSLQSYRLLPLGLHVAVVPSSSGGVEMRYVLP